jgi:hypothetical protein
MASFLYFEAGAPTNSSPEEGGRIHRNPGAFICHDRAT